MIDEKTEDRFDGALIGLAVGDALGTTLEFGPPTRTPHTEMIGGGPFNMKAGEWTDDTSMACCLAESLIICERFEARDQMARYVRWWRDGVWSVKGHCFDIGATTSRALSKFDRTGEAFAGGVSESDNGNGSLMRLAPIPMAYWRTPSLSMAYAVLMSRTTHGGSQAVASCALFSGLIARAIAGESKEALLNPEHSTVREVYDLDPSVAAVLQNLPFRLARDLRNTGYVMHGVEAALWWFANTDTFEDGLIGVVNMGGDADSNGAIYGQLAGAYYGVSGIPERWLRPLAWSSRLQGLCDRLWGFSTRNTQNG